jgi:hypothetical protein
VGGTMIKILFKPNDYKVSQFEFIDDWQVYMLPLTKALFDGGLATADEGTSDIDGPKRVEQQLRSLLASMFIEAGWEGDGNIRCFFIPPCFTGRSDGHSTVLFHVKQRNNGTSFVIYPKDLTLSLAFND